MKCAIGIAAFIASAATAGTVTVYDADFSVDGIGFDHTSNGNALEASPAVGPNFTLSYPSIPSSDTTLNFFITGGGTLTSSDFGGAHSFESFDIDVSQYDEVSISFINDFLGTDSFNNAPAEFIEYYYTLDGGAQTQFFFFTDDPNGPDLNASTFVNVAGVSTLRVGLNANVDGAGDGFDLSSVTVTGTPVPAPATIALTGLAGLAAARRRRA
ncbi:MAG: hypothetical protein CMJ31_02905 [Phycisphaerae bacterium]|nr:hypothetical protein [Phycisphaerae bacterium]